MTIAVNIHGPQGMTPDEVTPYISSTTNGSTFVHNQKICLLQDITENIHETSCGHSWSPEDAS